MQNSRAWTHFGNVISSISDVCTQSTVIINSSSCCTKPVLNLHLQLLAHISHIYHTTIIAFFHSSLVFSSKIPSCPPRKVYQTLHTRCKHYPVGCPYRGSTILRNEMCNYLRNLQTFVAGIAICTPTSWKVLLSNSCKSKLF
jgi:hypothetical protein